MERSSTTQRWHWVSVMSRASWLTMITAGQEGQDVNVPAHTQLITGIIDKAEEAKVFRTVVTQSLTNTHYWSLLSVTRELIGPLSVQSISEALSKGSNSYKVSWMHHFNWLSTCGGPWGSISSRITCDNKHSTITSYLLCIHWWPPIKHQLTRCPDCW